MSALSVHQSSTLPQKIDSREGLFWCKKGLYRDVGKMNIYLNKPPFVPTFVRSAAKYTVFCSKMHCVLVQNTR